MTHTPGPWHAEPKAAATDTDPGHTIIRGKTFERDGFTFHPIIARAYFGNANGEQESNARILAAAPGLLAALNAILAGIPWHRYPAQIEQARAAIAKATEQD